MGQKKIYLRQISNTGLLDLWNRVKWIPDEADEQETFPPSREVPADLDGIGPAALAGIKKVVRLEMIDRAILKPPKSKPQPITNMDNYKWNPGR